MIKANSEIMLIETPVAGIRSRAPRKEIGIPSMTQRARRICRKRLKIRKTMINPRKAFLIKRFIRLWKISEVSYQVEILIDAGMVGALSCTYL